MPWAMYALVAALALFAYINAIGNGFTLDDFGAIVENPTLRSFGSLGRIFHSNYWATGQTGTGIGDAGLYRPLTVLTFLLDYHVWGAVAAPYHLENVLLHVLVSVLVFIVARELTASMLGALAAAAVFAVHPLHTEAVSSIVGRAELLATLFFLLAFRIARRARAGEHATRDSLLAALLYFLGMLSKESAITLPAVLLLDDWFARAEVGDRAVLLKRSAIRYGALVFALILYLVLRTNAVGTHGTWLGWAGVSTGARLLTASRVLLEYLGLFLFPRVLLADYPASVVPSAHSLAEPLVLFSIIVWIALGVLIATKLRGDRRVILGALWFFVTILPASNIFFASGIGKAERILYLPTIGLCLLVGLAFAAAESKVDTGPLRALLVVAVLLLGVRTLRRNMDWQNNLTLAMATLRDAPGSPIMNDIAGTELLAGGQVQRALPLLRRSAQETPAIALAHSHLAAAYAAAGQLDSAVAEYHRGLTLDPGNAEMHSNLGLLFMNAGRLDDAVKEFEASTRASASSPEPLINLGTLYSNRGDYDAAVIQFTRALQIAPNRAEAHLDLGVVYLKQNHLPDAIREFTTSLQQNPRSPEGHNNLGFALLQSGDREQAITQFRIALSLRPNYPNARANLEKALKP